MPHCYKPAIGSLLSRSKGLNPPYSSTNKWSIDQKEQLKAFLDPFLDCLEEENSRQNLIRVQNRDEIWEKHIADVWIPIVRENLTLNGKVADIGSGNGIPGMVWSLLFPKADYFLIESQTKKARYLKSVVSRLGLDNVQVLQQRVESMGRPQSMDVVAVRAVDQLRIVLEYAAPIVKVGGLVFAFKGPNYPQEVAEARRCIHHFQYQLVQEIHYTLKWNQIFERVLLVYKKTKETSPQYPRSIGKARQKPI